MLYISAKVHSEGSSYSLGTCVCLYVVISRGEIQATVQFRPISNINRIILSFLVFIPLEGDMNKCSHHTPVSRWPEPGKLMIQPVDQIQ